MALALLSVLAACGSNGSTSAPATTTSTVAETTSTPPSTTSSTTSTTAPPAFDVAPIEWDSCSGGECATMPVPVDHDDPTGPTLSLALFRAPATGDRIGALVFNFGGPGAGATRLLPRFNVPSAIRERFDLVAMDPRGVGGSSPLDCGLDPVNLYSVDPTIEDDADAAALIAVSRDLADACDRAHPELVDHLGTWDVARDLDLVRIGLGDEQISFIGYSYGTAIGQAYAELFPTRLRGLVLDGVVDPAGSGLDQAVAQAAGFEAALTDWAAACPSRQTCPYADGAAAIGAVDDVLAAAEAGVPSSGRRALGPGETAIALAYPLYHQSQWDDLDRAIVSARGGDGTQMVALADSYLSLVDFTAYFAVSCVDSVWPSDPDVVLSRAAEAGRASPHFGEAIVNDYIRCAVWPGLQRPLGRIHAPGAPPILVISTTGDPATPYESGVAVAARLSSGKLLTYDGQVHTIAFQGSGCVDGLVTAYLIDGSVPGPSDHC